MLLGNCCWCGRGLRRQRVRYTQESAYDVVQFDGRQQRRVS